MSLESRMTPPQQLGQRNSFRSFMIPCSISRIKTSSTDSLNRVVSFKKTVKVTKATKVPLSAHKW